MTWIDGSKIGDFAFTDSDGLKRYRGRTCNLFGSVHDVVASFHRQRARQATVYVYRTVDGLYGGSVVKLSDDRTNSPEYIGAELVHATDGSVVDS